MGRMSCPAMNGGCSIPPLILGEGENLRTFRAVSILGLGRVRPSEGLVTVGELG